MDTNKVTAHVAHGQKRSSTSCHLMFAIFITHCICIKQQTSRAMPLQGYAYPFMLKVIKFSTSWTFYYTLELYI